MENFIYRVLVAAVGAAKRSSRGNRKLTFDYAVNCVIREMRLRQRYDLYQQARRIAFISATRKTVNEVVEYFGFTWSDVTSGKIDPRSCNTGVTPSQDSIDVSRETERYVSGNH